MSNLTNLTVAEYFEKLAITPIPFARFDFINDSEGGEEKTFLRLFIKTSKNLNVLLDEEWDTVGDLAFYVVPEMAAKHIIEDKTYNVYYNTTLDLYFIGIYHIGTPWNNCNVNVFKDIML